MLSGITSMSGKRTLTVAESVASADGPPGTKAVQVAVFMVVALTIVEIVRPASTVLTLAPGASTNAKPLKIVPS